MLTFFVVGTVLAVRWLPWWALVLGFLSLVMLGKFVIGRFVRKLFLMPFRAKGAVLNGASAHVHRISPDAAPETEGAAEASEEPREHYSVEVTSAQRSRPVFRYASEYKIKRPSLDQSCGYLLEDVSSSDSSVPVPLDALTYKL